MWRSLEKIYQSTTQSHVMNLRSQLISLHKGDKFFNDYLVEVKTIKHHLTSIGGPVPEIYMIMYTI